MIPASPIQSAAKLTWVVKVGSDEVSGWRCRCGHDVSPNGEICGAAGNRWTRVGRFASHHIPAVDHPATLYRIQGIVVDGS